MRLHRPAAVLVLLLVGTCALASSSRATTQVGHGPDLWDGSPALERGASFFGEPDVHAAITSAVTIAIPTSAAIRTFDCTRRRWRVRAVRGTRIGGSSSPTT